MRIDKKLGDVITVEWDDAIQYAEWKSAKSASEHDKSVSCVTRGFFVSQNKNFVTVCHTKAKFSIDDDSVCGILKIPKGMIRKVK